MSMESLYKLSILVNMIDRVSDPAARIVQKTGEAADSFQKYSSGMADMARDGVVLIGTGAQIANGMMVPIKATFATQDALSELSSLGVEQLGLLEDAATDFSNTWAGTTKPEFISAAYDIKSGIASLTDEGVAGYTELSGVTAKATKSTISEMTNLFATGYGIYKDYYSSLSDLEFGEIFSAGISQSVKQFKTTGSGMAQAISALGGTATAAMVPLEEQLSVLGMLQATMSGSEAGTKYTAFLQTAAKAGKDLGLNFTDATGQLKSLPEILGMMQGKFGDVLTAADKLELQKAFGTIEAVKLIDLLYGKTNDLQGNIIDLYDTMGQGMSITDEMANKINAPPGQSWELLRQKMQNTLETVGNAMLPQFAKLQNSFDVGATKLAEFTEKHPELVSNIMYAVMAFGAFMTALGVGKFVIGGFGTAITGLIKIHRSWKDETGSIRKALNLLQKGISGAKPVLLSLGKGFLSACTSVWTFTAALLANPITWVVIGIVALIAAIVLLYKNWDTVTAFLGSTWDSVCGGITSAIDWVREKLDGIPDSFKWIMAAVFPFIGVPLLIIDNWDAVKSFFANLPENLKQGFYSLKQWFLDFFAGLGTTFRQSGERIITTFTDGIMTMARKPIEAVRGVLQKIRDMMPFSDAKEGPLSQLTLSGSRVFTTFADGMNQTAQLPARTAEKAFDGISDDTRLTAPDTGDGKRTETRQTIIQKLILNIDLKDLDDLKKLKRLIAEIEDGINGNDPGTDPQPAF